MTKISLHSISSRYHWGMSSYSLSFCVFGRASSTLLFLFNDITNNYSNTSCGSKLLEFVPLRYVLPVPNLSFPEKSSPELNTLRWNQLISEQWIIHSICGCFDNGLLLICILGGHNNSIFNCNIQSLIIKKNDLKILVWKKESAKIVWVEITSHV